MSGRLIGSTEHTDSYFYFYIRLRHKDASAYEVDSSKTIMELGKGSNIIRKMFGVSEVKEVCHQEEKLHEKT